MLNARKTDPSTSHDAMKRINGYDKKIVDSLDLMPSGATCNQIGGACGLPRDSVSPNMPNLERMGYVKRSGYKRGREQVWISRLYFDCFTPLKGDKEMEEKAPVKTKQDLQEELQALKNVYYASHRLTANSMDMNGFQSNAFGNLVRSFLKQEMQSRGFEGY